MVAWQPGCQCPSPCTHAGSPASAQHLWLSQRAQGAWRMPSGPRSPGCPSAESQAAWAGLQAADPDEQGLSLGLHPCLGLTLAVGALLTVPSRASRRTARMWRWMKQGLGGEGSGASTEARLGSLQILGTQAELGAQPRTPSSSPAGEQLPFLRCLWQLQEHPSPLSGGQPSETLVLGTHTACTLPLSFSLQREKPCFLPSAFSPRSLHLLKNDCMQISWGFEEWVGACSHGQNAEGQSC